MLTVSMIIAFAQPSLAQVGVIQPEKTVGFASVAPLLIGVGQTATVNLWVYPLPTTNGGSPYFNGFYGITVTFVRPDGTKDTFMPTDETGSYAPGQMQALGALYFFYKPDMVGNWSVSFTMPAQNITDFTGTVQYLGCTSKTAYFTVQQDPVLAGLLNGYPWSPLPNPNVYWNYPINTNNREWSAISGDFTGIAITMANVNSVNQLRWQPYGPGPNTGHIVWDQPIKSGGLIGGAYGSLGYQGVLNTITTTTPCVIMDGKVFINIPNTTPFGGNFGQFQCYDEATGKLLYTANGTITNGIHIAGNTYQQAASSIALNQSTVVLESSIGSSYVPWLYGTVTVGGITYWNYYDAFTGVLQRQIANASTARLVDGTPLAFGAATSVVGYPNIRGSGYIYAWNMSKVVNNNWPTGITWIKQMPINITQRTASIFAVSQDASTIVFYNYQQYWGYNAKTGASLWNLTLDYQANTNEELQLATVDNFIIWDSTDTMLHCYSIRTGALLWSSPSFADSTWASTWTHYNSETADYDNLYMAFEDGTMAALSLATGKLLWRSQPIASTEYTNNVVPFVMGGLILVGGNLYGYAGYTTGYQINPVPRFAMLVCINATTGDIIYTLNGGICPTAAANGYLIGNSVNDGSYYCIGKGPTSTSVSIQNDVIANGATVLIKGNVMDMSPASQDYAVKVRFPNGVPAVADSAMSEWMDYLYMQNATLLNNPPKPNGVTVRVAAMDNNGQVTDLGTTTSDYTGQFSLPWKPTTEGMYKIFATFDGSNSYFGSYAATGLSVGKAATETSAPQQTIPDYTMTIIGAAIAIMIVVAIVGVALFFTLRKR
ncbi:MAG TPA: PQQ-binding-like beta-propeller repeat protein [Candidatus Sulfotelmatobacter sp.]|nr:PQQ-binding-like beta-propeller repeat protein [Candidatus Sulfotelmatobacter sp.]